MGVQMCPHCLCNPCCSQQRYEVRVEVVDAVNTNRILGTLPKPDMKGGFDRLRMPCMGRPALDFRQVSFDEVMNVTYVDCEARIIRTGPLDAKGVLATHNTLEDLMKVRDFRLPGETAEAAARRFWNA